MEGGGPGSEPERGYKGWAYKPGGRTLTVFFGSRWMKSTQSQRWGPWLEEHSPGDFLVATHSAQPPLVTGELLHEGALGLNCAHLQDALVCRLARAQSGRKLGTPGLGGGV